MWWSRISLPEIYKTAHASHREDLTQSPLQHTQKTCLIHRFLGLGTQDTICAAILNPLQSFIKTFNDFMKFPSARWGDAWLYTLYAIAYLTVNSTKQLDCKFHPTVSSPVYRISRIRLTTWSRLARRRPPPSRETRPLALQRQKEMPVSR